MASIVLKNSVLHKLRYHESW